MKASILWITCAALWVAALGREGTAATCTSTESCLQVIERAQQETRSISAAFVQVKHLSLLDEPLESSGRFTFERPDRVLLELEKPQPARVRIIGQDVQIPNLPERDRQAMSMAPMAAMFAQLGAIFTGATQRLQEGFEVTAEEKGGAIHVHLIPRKDDWKRLFRRIDLQFLAPQFFTQQIHLEDGLGDSLDISLHDVQRNVDIPAGTFEGE